MKKVSASVTLLVVIMFIAGPNQLLLASYNFGELNIKAGLQTLGKVSNIMEVPGEERDLQARNFDSNNYVWSGEYLIFLGSLDWMKLGLGLSYSSKSKDADDWNSRISYLPIYFTLQVNPFTKSASKGLHGIFIKGNVGYNALFDVTISDKLIDDLAADIDKVGGVHYAFCTGYEFPFGLFLDLGYFMYAPSLKITLPNGQEDSQIVLNIRHSRTTLAVGYKFKI